MSSIHESSSLVAFLFSYCNLRQSSVRRRRRRRRRRLRRRRRIEEEEEYCTSVAAVR
jgi:hypothetical protein